MNNTFQIFTVNVIEGCQFLAVDIKHGNDIDREYLEGIVNLLHL